MSKTVRLLCLCILPLGAAACDDASGPEDEVSMSLSFAVQPRGGLAGLSPTAAYTPALTHGASTLELDVVELNVEELVIERADLDGSADSDGDSEADSDSDGPFNEKFGVEGATVALPLDGDVVTPFLESIPAGFYEEVELDIRSVRLVGTVDGEAFDETILVDLELEMEFEPPLEVVEGEAPQNVTITVDPLLWLEHDDGSFIDPRDLAGDEALLNRLRQRMALSFDAFEDSDHDADDEDSDSDSDDIG